MRQFLLISLFLFPAITFASGSGAWCLVVDENEFCGYPTAEVCYQKAANGGFCRQNAQLMGVTGERGWCVITDTRRTCTYGGQKACLRAALEQGGGCVQNTENALARARGGWGSAAEEEEGFDFEFDINYE